MLNNPVIESLIIQAQVTPMAIDPQFGLDAILGYSAELEQLKAGIPAKKLGISGKRHASLPSLVVTSENGNIEHKAFSEIETIEGAVAILRISGVMRMEDGMSSRGIASFVEDLRAADSASGVSAIIVEINSGGGEVTAGQAAFAAMSGASKPLEAVVHYAGSAAYMAATGADKIHAVGPMTSVGSIGVLVSLSRGFADMYNKYIEDIYSNLSPNKNIEFRQLLKGNRAPLIQSIDETAEQFQALVLGMRTLKGGKKRIAETLSGGMFGVTEAIKRGLIDDQKNTNQVAEGLIERANNGGGRLVSASINLEAKMATLKDLFKIKTGTQETADDMTEEVTEEVTEEETQETTDEVTEESTNQEPDYNAVIQGLTAAVNQLNENQSALNESLKAIKADLKKQEVSTKVALKEVANLSGASALEAQEAAADSTKNVQTAESDFVKKRNGFKANPATEQ